MDVFDKFDVAEKDLVRVNGFDQGVEEAGQRVFECGGTFALCNDGILGQILL